MAMNSGLARASFGSAAGAMAAPTQQDAQEVPCRAAPSWRTAIVPHGRRLVAGRRHRGRRRRGGRAQQHAARGDTLEGQGKQQQQDQQGTQDGVHGSF
jgi:hypothetical protein